MEQPSAADIVTMKNLLNPAETFAMDDDFLMAEVRLDGSRTVPTYQFGGLTFIICDSGTLKITLNNEKEVLIRRSFATVVPPTSLVQFEGQASGENSDTVFLLAAISQKYLFDLKLDMGELFDHMRQEKFKLLIKDPSIELGEDLYRLVKEHCTLIRDIYLSDLRQKKYHFTLLLSSMLNIVSVAFNQDNGMVTVRPGRESPSAPLSRSKTVFSDFMKMAVENFERERSIRFYADKLCLTPKYLSKLIKEGCGSSASTIVDNLVIAKAKSMLKHSDYPVKLIAAQLNFSSQSSFNKFFKAKTGMSPLKFRSL